jgi:hypothetical protein
MGTMAALPIEEPATWLRQDRDFFLHVKFTGSAARSARLPGGVSKLTAGRSNGPLAGISI